MVVESVFHSWVPAEAPGIFNSRRFHTCQTFQWPHPYKCICLFYMKALSQQACARLLFVIYSPFCRLLLGHNIFFFLLKILAAG